MVRRDLRIVIAGGGLSGLAAAFLLRERGFRHITLHEAQEEVGGKISSLRIGGEVVEEGAVFGSYTARLLTRMARAAGFVDLVPFHAPGVVIDHGREHDIYRWHGGAGPREALACYARLVACLLSPRMAAVLRPGFHHAPDELLRNSTRQWARDRGFEPVLEPLAVFLHGMGYGSVDEIPALYHVKMIAGALRNRALKRVTLGFAGGHFHCPGGYRTLLTAVARWLRDQGVDVRTGSGVTRVTRPARGQHGPVEVTAGGGTTSHDLLICAIPAARVPAILDLDENERRLFEKVHHLDYHSVVVRAPGLRRGAWVGLPAFRGPGQVTMFHGLDPASDLVIAYQYGAHDLDRILRQDLTSLGARSVEILSRRPWRYFPHVPLGLLDRDFHPTLESLQGQRATCHVGALFNGETTQLVLDHVATQVKSQPG